MIKRSGAFCVAFIHDTSTELFVKADLKTSEVKLCRQPFLSSAATLQVKAEQPREKEKVNQVNQGVCLDYYRAFFFCVSLMPELLI